jgi:hypothetical protein
LYITRHENVPRILISFFLFFSFLIHLGCSDQFVRISTNPTDPEINDQVSL